MSPVPSHTSHGTSRGTTSRGTSRGGGSSRGRDRDRAQSRLRVFQLLVSGVVSAANKEFRSTSRLSRLTSLTNEVYNQAAGANAADNLADVPARIQLPQ
eukprot:5451469-Amphidinium_carterae.1